jgi:hypothetical protein
MTETLTENPIRKALKDKLVNDEALKTLATGVFHKEAKPGAEMPYIIFFKSSGVPEWAFDGPPMDKETWTIKAVGKRSDAEKLDRRCKKLLNGSTLAIEGKVHQDIRHIGDIDFDETVKGERVQDRL